MLCVFRITPRRVVLEANQRQKQIPEAFEIWLHQNIVRIPWTDRVTNIEVLGRLNKEIEIKKTVKKIKFEDFRHIMRHLERYNLQHLHLQDKVED